MRPIKIKRAGGYDPKLGPKHPENQDPTLVKSTFGKDNSLTRTVSMSGIGNMGMIRITETENDEAVVATIGGDVKLDAQRLWDLACGIVDMFGGTVLNHDQQRVVEQTLTDKIRDVLCANEARCLDDDIDREVVLRELVKALVSP